MLLLVLPLYSQSTLRELKVILEGKTLSHDTKNTFKPGSNIVKELLDHSEQPLSSFDEHINHILTDLTFPKKFDLSDFNLDHFQTDTRVKVSSDLQY